MGYLSGMVNYRYRTTDQNEEEKEDDSEDAENVIRKAGAGWMPEPWNREIEYNTRLRII